MVFPARLKGNIHLRCHRSHFDEVAVPHGEREAKVSGRGIGTVMLVMRGCFDVRWLDGKFRSELGGRGDFRFQAPLFPGSR